MSKRHTIYEVITFAVKQLKFQPSSIQLMKKGKLEYRMLAYITLNGKAFFLLFEAEKNV